jgi:hypothetical protein
MKLLLYAITLTLIALPLAPRADAQNQDDPPFQTITGTIAEVRPKDRQVTLMLRKGEFLRLTADDRTRIDFPKTEGKLELLQPGKRVRVSFYVKDGTYRLLAVAEPRFTLGKLKQGINLALAMLKSASFKEREDYKKNLQIIIEDVDDQIAALEVRSKQEPDAAVRKQIAQDVEALRRQREALRDQFVRVNAATADNWAEARDGVNNAIDTLQRLLEQARLRAAAKGQP